MPSSAAVTLQINYTEDAFRSLLRLINYIDSTNTQGAGLRWMKRYETYLDKKLRAPEPIRLCNNATFTQLQLRCIYFNDWVIAFSIHPHFVLIEAVLHTSRIGD